jgi:predicted dehydrogenase
MLRVGIIGTGDIANLNVLGYLHSPHTELVAVSDLETLTAGQKLERWGLRTVKIYNDYRKMIDNEDLDIIEILTPHHLHFPMTKYAAEAGIRGISVQKPMAHTISDCEKMIHACEENGVILKLYENFRFYPVYLKAKELLEGGIIGDLLTFRINTISTGGPSMPRGLKSLTWRHKVDTCGGGPLVYDDGIHKFSMALWLMNQERVEQLYGWIDYFATVLDSPSIIFWKYPSINQDDPPRCGSMQFTSAPNVYYPSNYYDCDEYIEITGSKGVMWINQGTSGGNFISHAPEFPPIITFVDGKVKHYGEDLPRDWRYSFINSTEHFINVIKNGGTPVYTGEQGKNLCIFAKMPYISYQQKRIVYWNEITPENEENKSCIVEEPLNLDESGLTKFFRRKRDDFRKGIKSGLENKIFKYQYEK